MWIPHFFLLCLRALLVTNDVALILSDLLPPLKVLDLYVSPVYR